MKYLIILTLLLIGCGENRPINPIPIALKVCEIECSKLHLKCDYCNHSGNNHNCYCK